MTEFERREFSVKEWINDSCRKRLPTESIEKYITQLELQLQIESEETENEIETMSNRLSQQIPFVLQGAEKVKSEMVTLHESLGTTLGSLHEQSRTAKTSLKNIHELHQIKTNMQSACNSLKEATELSELFVRVDAVFGSGDLFAMAKIMTTMHRSLKLVGNVPEFESGKQKLRRLEENLAVSVESKLTNAISEEQSALWLKREMRAGSKACVAEQVVRLSEILISLERKASLEKIYLSVRRSEMKTELEHAAERLAAGDVAAGVERWYEVLSMLVRKEIDWCGRVLPTMAPSLLAALIPAATDSWNMSLSAALEKYSSVQTCIAVQASTVELCSTFKATLEGIVGEEAMEVIVKRLLEPTEAQVARIAELEEAIMMRCVDPRTTDWCSIPEIETAMARLFQSIDAALDDTIVFTGGSEIVSVTKRIEFSLVQFVSTLTASLKALRLKILPQSPLADADIPASLQLLKNGQSFDAYVQQCRQKISDVMNEILHQLQQPPKPIDLVQLRLGKREGKKAALMEFLEKGEWTGHTTLSPSLSGLAAASEALVFDVFMHKPRSLFHGHSAFPFIHPGITSDRAGFGEMAEWTNDEASTPLASALPQFHAYPLHYVSNLGEYLMLVPQQLEALVPADTDDTSHDQKEETASTLLNKVIVGSAELYGDEILALERLTKSGEAQLKCDLDYFSNVLSAMGSTIPQSLSFVTEAVQCSVETLQSMITSTSTTGNRRSVLETMHRLRTATLS